MLCGGCWHEAERPEHLMGFCLPALSLMPGAPEAGGEGGGGAGRATWDLSCHLPPTPVLRGDVQHLIPSWIP